MLLCFIALVLGVFICDWYILPRWYERTLGLSNNYIMTSYLANYRLWIVFVGILFFTGFAAGGYPAFYVSRFRPVNILSGNQKLAGKKMFTRVLITTQFVITSLLLAFTILMRNQVEFLYNIDKGYTQENVYTVYVKDGKRFELLNNELKANPSIVNTAGTADHIGMSFGTGTAIVDNVEINVAGFHVSADYLETIELRLKDGRFFNRDQIETQNVVIVNETFVNAFDWENGVGKTFRSGDKSYTIIGVVEDFHYRAIRQRPIQPTMLQVAPKDQYRLMVTRVRPGGGDEAFRFIEERWSQLFPGETANEFMDQIALEKAGYEDMENVIGIYRYMTIITLFISCVGLFGLVSLQVSRRKKEISVHKVLGSSLFNVFTLLLREFILVISISSAIAIPISYFGIYKLIDLFWAYSTGASVIPLMLITGSIFTIALVTVFGYVYKAATANPVDALRTE